MADPILCFPNYLDNTFYSVKIGGGSWLSTRPLSNLMLDAFSRTAQSSSAANDDTQFYVDLGGLRGIRNWAIPFHNMTLDATYRVRGSDTPKFANATVYANASLGASSFQLQAGATDVVILAGEIFSFTNHSTVYKATSNVTILAGAFGTVNISPSLESAITATSAITCNSGDFSSPVYDSGVSDVFAEVYPFDSIDTTHPSWWTGKPTEEQRLNLPFPVLDVFSLALARYWYFEFFDSTNADGYIRLPRLFIAPGYQPSNGIAYGAKHDWVTDTRVDTTLGGRRIYGVEPIARTLLFSIEDLTVDEATSNFFDIQTEAGIHKQLFFIFDPDDTTLMHRRAFLATFERPSSLNHPYYNRIHTALEIREVVA